LRSNNKGQRSRSTSRKKRNIIGPEVDDDDGSGSEFSAKDGSPPDFHNRKHERNNPTSGGSALKPKNLLMVSNSGSGTGSHDGNANDKFKIDSTSDLSVHSPTLLKEFQMLKNNDKYIIPPPEDLIARTVFTVEPIRTGAPISFV